MEKIKKGVIVYFPPSAAKNTCGFGAKKRRKAGTLNETKPLEYSEERAVLKKIFYKKFSWKSILYAIFI
jgi:hypothetical protein